MSAAGVAHAHTLAELPYTEVERILALPRPKIAIVPAGSTEAHGPHLPLSTDSIISEAMAKRAAVEIARQGREAVVFPTIHYAVTDWAAAFSGSTTIPVQTASAIVLDTCAAAKAMGFDAVVLTNAHLEPDNIATLRNVTKAFVERTGAPLLFPDVTRRRIAERLTEEFRSGSCHAGQYETSIVLAVAPQLVRMDVARALPEHHVPLHVHIQNGAKDFLECGLDQAYCGNPAQASAAEGEETLRVLAEVTAELVASHFEAPSP